MSEWIMSKNNVYIIAEMSANHNHSLEVAIQTIQAAALAGVDAVKLQTYTADTITLNSDSDVFRIKGTAWNGMNLYQLYQQASTPWEWYPELKKVAYDMGVDLFSSPFDSTAVDFLEKYDVPCYKVASFELVDIPLLEKIGETHKPVILSTGMATIDEIEDAIQTLHNAGTREIALLKCTSAYPASPENMNLSTITDMQKRFGCRVGLSDHTLGTEIAIAAVALGATIIEKHLIIDRSLGGPDAHFSCTPTEFREMVNAIRRVEKALGAPFYGVMPEEEASKVFRRSLFAAKAIRKGEVFTVENIRSVRPAYGLPPKQLSQILGKKATTDIPFATPICRSHFE